jgi:hypothetical protein
VAKNAEEKIKCSPNLEKSNRIAAIPFLKDGAVQTEAQEVFLAMRDTPGFSRAE